MEKRLGISVYPHKSPLSDNLAYIDRAASLGYKRLFSCMLSINDAEEMKNFRTMSSHAASRGMDVFLDIAPEVFDKLNIDPNDYTFFKEIGAAGVRLDTGYNGQKESTLTHNPQDLSIELNMSYDIAYLDLIESYAPRWTKLQGCHNFYPQVCTGINWEHFISASLRFKERGLRTAAFVTCQQGIGPWLINDGLCTLEKHRNLPIHVQAQDLWGTGLIDDVIIGDAFATPQQMELLASLNPEMIEIGVVPESGISETDKEILKDPDHFRRGDSNDYLIRSTAKRASYSKRGMPPKAYKGGQMPGDIFVGNDSFGNYKGELQICIAPCPNDGRKNRIGCIPEEELCLLSHIQPWSRFRLRVQ